MSGEPPPAGTPPGTGPASNVIAPPAAPPGAPPPPPPAAPPVPPAQTTFTIDLSTATERQRELFQKKGYDKNPNGLLQSYDEANAALSGSKDVVAIPADDAKPDSPEVARYRVAMGIPEKPDDYKFEYPQGFTPDAATESFGRKFFHEIGVPQSKIPKALEMWNAFAADQNANFSTTQVDANVNQIKALRGSMDEAKWNKVVADGQTAFKALDLPAETHLALEKSLGAAAVVHLFSALGARLGEGGFKTPAGGSNGPVPASGMTVEQARAEIVKLENNKEWYDVYLDKNHAQNQSHVRRMTELYSVAHPGRR